MPVRYFKAAREGLKHFRSRFGSFFGSFFAFFKPFFVSILKFFGGNFILQTCRPNNPNFVAKCVASDRPHVSVFTCFSELHFSKATSLLLPFLHSLLIRLLVNLLRAAKPAEVCVVKCLVKFDLEFDLKFEISDGKHFW